MTFSHTTGSRGRCGCGRNGDRLALIRAHVTACAAIAIAILGPGNTALVRRSTGSVAIPRSGWIAGVDSRAAREQDLCECRTTVVPQRTKQWVDTEHVAGGRAGDAARGRGLN